MSIDAGTIRVWDPFVRIAHLLLIVGFAIAYVTEGEPAWLHEWSGYGVAAVVVARIVWGFVGSTHACFSDFIVGPVAALAYLRQLIAFRAPRHLGHSPAGAMMVVALLVSLAVTTASGITYLGVSRNRGPLAGWLGAEAAALEAAAVDAGTKRIRRPGRWIKEVHEISANLTLLLIIGHLGGVALASFAHRENLPRAMITGRKRIASEPHA